MNKRQIKKRQKKIIERIESLKKYIQMYGRHNGKTVMIRKINHAIHCQRHKPFKELIKEFDAGKKRINHLSRLQQK